MKLVIKPMKNFWQRHGPYNLRQGANNNFLLFSILWKLDTLSSLAIRMTKKSHIEKVAYNHKSYMSIEK